MGQNQEPTNNLENENEKEKVIEIGTKSQNQKRNIKYHWMSY